MRAAILIMAAVIGTLSYPAYGQSKTYEKCEIIVGESEGKTFVAVKDKYGSEYSVTMKVPYGLTKYRVSSGIYFCERDLFKGIKEFVDDNGNVWTFDLIVKWEKIRP